MFINPKNKRRARGKMEEKEINNKEQDRAPRDERIDAGGVKIKLPVSKRFENYWYHYKWHTIAAIFVLIVTVVVIVQCAARERYDVHILYAGDKAISTSKSNPERQRFVNALRSVSSDFDGDGEVNVAFKHLYAPDEEELARLEELEKKGEGEIPHSLIFDDQKTLDTLLAQSDYYLLLLDKAVFDRCCERGVISSVLNHLPEGFEGEIVEGTGGGSGILLRDTGFYKLEGIKTLPEDTVVCIKLANAFATDDDLEKLADSVEVFKKIVRS